MKITAAAAICLLAILLLSGCTNTMTGNAVKESSENVEITGRYSSSSGEVTGEFCVLPQPGQQSSTL